MKYLFSRKPTGIVCITECPYAFRLSFASVNPMDPSLLEALTGLYSLLFRSESLRRQIGLETKSHGLEKAIIYPQN